MTEDRDISDELDSGFASEGDDSGVLEAPLHRYCNQCGRAIAADAAFCELCHRQSQLLPATRGIVVGPAHPVLDTVGHYSLWLVCFLPFMFLQLDERDDPHFETGLEIGVSATISVLVLAWAAVRHRTILPLLWRPFRVQWLVAPFLLSIVSYAFALLFVRLAGLMGVEDVKLTESFQECGYGPIFVVVLMCLQPAIVEELSFRGIIYNALGTVLSVRETVIVSSVMFAVLHLSAFGLPQLILGFALAWLRIRSGTIVPCMILHFFHNFWCILGEYYGS